ncbi:hypothetical protein BT67DRAFT_445456 [Trichocladium antarcticum]|uniref:Uncharacterized protein n=1 Tax=Trichocladium antarcticum TaxID=1450529 RepID=A0AAN6UDM4_9PEZI|nr:hypothetical protein BT67DRAFT_445456 [Trichocladium antarcticum]
MRRQPWTLADLSIPTVVLPTTIEWIHLLTLLGSYIVREVHSEGGYATLLENEISAPKDARLPLFATSA